MSLLPLINQVTSTYNNNEKKIFNDGILAYIDRLTQNISTIKNKSLYFEPKSFQQTYITASVRLNEDKTVSLANPIGFLKKYPKITVVGSAGTGKTSLLKFIANESVVNSFKVPILIEVRKLIEVGITVEAFIQQHLFNLDNISFSIFNHQNWLFLFDGYDEVHPEKDTSVINNIQDFIYRNHKSSIVITSRLGTNIETLPNFYSFKIKPLTLKEKSSFINMSDLSVDLKESIYQKLETDAIYNKLIFSPLLLTNYISFMREQTETNMIKKSNLLSTILETLISQHDISTKFGYRRKNISGISSEQIKNMLSELAYINFVKNKKLFSTDEFHLQLNHLKNKYHYQFINDDFIYDVSVNLNMIYRKGHRFQFVNPLIEDYLITLFVCSLSKASKEIFYATLAEQKLLQPSYGLLVFLHEMDEHLFEKNYLIKVLENLNKNRSDYKLKKYIDLIQFIKYLLKISDTSNIQNLLTHYKNSHLQEKADIDKLINL